MLPSLPPNPLDPTGTRRHLSQPNWNRNSNFQLKFLCQLKNQISFQWKKTLNKKHKNEICCSEVISISMSKVKNMQFDLKCLSKRRRPSFFRPKPPQPHLNLKTKREKFSHKVKMWCSLVFLLSPELTGTGRKPPTPAGTTFRCQVEK